MNISSTDTKPLPKSGRAKREQFLARASANTGMDRRFMSDGGSSAADSKRPDGPVIFCLHRDGNVTYQKNKEDSPLARDEYHVEVGPDTWRELDLNSEPDRKLLKKYLIHDEDFYDWVLKSSRTPQSVESILSRAAQNHGGEAFWDGAFKFTSKVSTTIGTGATVLGTTLLWAPPVGEGLIILGEGMVKFGAGVSIFNDLRKGDWKGAAINGSFYLIGGQVAKKLKNARSLGFNVPYKPQEINLINGMSLSVFNMSNITVNEAMERKK